MNDIIKCPKCGSEMNYFHKNNTQGYRCPKCNHLGPITTYFTEKEDDQTIYHVILDSQEPNTEKIRMLSHLSKKNFLECKKLLEIGGEAFNGKAGCLRVGENMTFEEKLEFLNNANIAYRILPKYSNN